VRWFRWAQWAWVWLIRIVAVLVALFLLTVVTLPIAKWYARFLDDRIFQPLKIHDLPEPLFMLLSGILIVTPLMVFPLVYFWFLLRQKTSGDRENIFEKQLRALAEVQQRLSEAQTFAQGVTQEIADYQKRYSELTDLIQTVDELAKESDEKLKQKLAAIERTTALRENVRVAISFVLGFISSLLASAVWSFLSAGLR